MENQFVQSIQALIQSIRNIAIASVNELKKFSKENTLSVKVENPINKVDVSGSVEVSNFKPVIDTLKGLPISIQSLKKPILSEKKVSVTNLKDIKIPKVPEFPKKIEVSNLKDKVEISNMKDFTDGIEKVAEFLAKVKYDPRIEVNPTPVNIKAPVVNIPKQDAPIVNVEAPDLSDIKKIIKFLEALGEKKPLPVRLSDGKSFYKSLEKMADIYAGSTFSAFQDQSGLDGRAILNRNNEIYVTTSESWITNNVHKVSSSLIYLGEETVDGRWRITKVENSGDIQILKYATKRNNSIAVDFDYPTAWDNHEDFEYDRVSIAL